MQGVKSVRSLLILLIFPTAAIAQSEERKNTLENLASLVVASRWCNDYIINKESIADIAIAAGVNFKNKSEKDHFEKNKDEFEKIMGEAGASAYCSYAYKIFGPGGKIPGLMMKK